jgi:glycine cleavage system H protein
MSDNVIRYTKDHEWIEWNGAVAMVGITQHAADALGDIVYVDLPELKSFGANDPCAVVESVKAASDVYCPIAGTVTSVNESLRDDPSLINKEPTGLGWFWTMTIDNESDLDGLMSAEEYQKFVDSTV